MILSSSGLVSCPICLLRFIFKNDLNNVNEYLGEDGDPHDPVGRLGGDAVVAVQLTVVAEHLQRFIERNE